MAHRDDGVNLLVFSDDWGRHPTSCQHLVRRLLPRYSTTWVNVIGMRRPRFEWYTVIRGLEKARQWFGPSEQRADLPANLRVVSPVLWPGFGNSFERQLNRRLMQRALKKLINESKPPVAVTTQPITVDLIDRIPARRWIYYCVDDFSTWPGLDHAAVRRLENQLIERADRIVAVSEQLCRRVAQLNRTADLLTHGVDLEMWTTPNPNHIFEFDLPRPWLVFWGLIDRRMDVRIITQLANSGIGSVLLAGPEDDADPALKQTKNVRFLGPVPNDQLPALAAVADVLLLPYADLPVTRAIQPLKLKEYLATGKAVVATDLPAVREWSDCLDISSTVDEYVGLAKLRSITGATSPQLNGRKRLTSESWEAKADRFASILFH